MFKNDSNSHWEYYSYGNNKKDSYIIKCFDYIEWDIEMIEKIKKVCNGIDLEKYPNINEIILDKE